MLPPTAGDMGEFEFAVENKPWKRRKRGELYRTFPQPQDISGDGLLTLKEGASVLRCGLSKIYTLINSGELESVMIGGARRITKKSLRHIVSGGAPVC